mgnify:CR=1 FL=1
MLIGQAKATCIVGNYNYLLLSLLLLLLLLFFFLMLMIFAVVLRYLSTRER